jgi:PAS domain-containing protein
LHAVLVTQITTEVEVTKRGLPAEALARYEMIMRHSLDVISTHESLSGSCSFLSVSPSVTRLMGYTVDDLLGRPLFDFVSRKDYARVVDELHCIVQSWHESIECGPDGNINCAPKHREGVTTTIEYRLKCKNGERKLVETGVSIGMEGQGTVLVLVTRNVGERKAQELERRERENLEMSMAVRQQYISSIAHDLKTPISTFQLALDLLR